MNRAIYITRCDIGWYSKNANAYRKPLEVATKYETMLVVPDYCRVPQEIAEKCCKILRFRRVWDVLSRRDAESQSDIAVFTGFDFPCMYVGWQLKKRFGCKWTVFLWDPPCLSHRDGFPPLRWAVDVFFRFLAKRCDKLVLNIHPGLLDEIGYKPRDGQLEVRMQDAFEGVSLPDATNSGGYEYDFGVLANWERGKGGPFLARALMKMPTKCCLWIGDAPRDEVSSQIVFTGRMVQNEAFDKLKKCRVLVVPYLASHAFKWNYPLKLFEYLRLGRPIIASDNPGNAAVANRYQGRISLFRSGDILDFIAKASVLA